MASNRKYTTEEIDYVHARIEAGWNFDTIAKAFKIDFAPHWANKNITKKQIQYIKSAYKRAPGTIKPYEGPIPTFPPSPTSSATSSTALDQNNTNQPAYRDPASDFNAGPFYPPANAEGEAQYMNQYSTIAGAPDNAFDSSSSVYPDPLTLGSSALSVDPYQQQLNNPSHNTNVAAQSKQQQQQPASALNYGTWNQGADNHAVDARYSGYGARLDNDPGSGIPSLQNGLLNSGGPSLGAGGQQQAQQQQQPSTNSNALFDPDNYSFDFNLPSSNLNIDPSLTSQVQTQPAGRLPNYGAPGPAQLTPPDCSPERMVNEDERGWWYSAAHDACSIGVAHRHDFDGVIGFRDVHGYRYNMQMVIDGLLARAGLSYDAVAHVVRFPVLEPAVEGRR